MDPIMDTCHHKDTSIKLSDAEDISKTFFLYEFVGLHLIMASVSGVTGVSLERNVETRHMTSDVWGLSGGRHSQKWRAIFDTTCVSLGGPRHRFMLFNSNYTYIMEDDMIAKVIGYIIMAAFITLFIFAVISFMAAL